MSKILLLSDTHAHLDDSMLSFVEKADQIWHAGDIGTIEVTQRLMEVNPNLVAVYGNIDGTTIRQQFPKDQIFTVKGKKIWMTHIGSYPPNYTKIWRERLDKVRPDVFICGHSHILKVIYDKERKLLHLNPGAAGIYGFQKVRTMIQFEITEDGFKNMAIIELGKR